MLTPEALKEWVEDSGVDEAIARLNIESLVGFGKKPGEESRRCGDCKRFLGFSPLARLKKARRRKKLTECLQILENQGIQGELALFTLSLLKNTL